MLLCKVSGKIWLSKKTRELEGTKLVIADEVDAAMNKTGKTIIAADSLGAGTGDLVLITTGSQIKLSEDYKYKSVDAAVVGIVDDYELGNDNKN